MKQTPLRSTDTWSSGCWKWTDSLEEKHVGWKGLTWQSRLSWRISTPIEIWEHRLGKVWNQHLCWHLILARYRLQWRWSQVNGFSAWKDSCRRVEPLWCFSYIHSTLSYGPKLYSEWHNSMFRVVFGQSRLQDDLGWRRTLKELSSSHRGNRFWYINHLNPSSYAKVRGNTLQTEPQRKYGTRCQTLVW